MWIIIGIVVVLLMLLASQGYNIYMGTLTLGITSTIKTAPGEVMKEGTTFTKFGKLDSRTDKKGTIERVEYTTDVYEDGVTYKKYCNVYLPYGYDANNKDKKYNVLYFQHGNTADPDIFTAPKTKNWLDNLFASGDVEPVIIVFTTYYMDVTKDTDVRKKTGNIPAGDGNWEGLPGNFYREVVEDIIPTVESRYNTYTESFDRDGLIASRDHRGFSGYSRGGVCTWYMFHNAFEYFKWYSPMSCHVTAGQRISFDVSNEEAFRYLKEAVDAHPDLDFFIYAASGNPNDGKLLRTQMAYFEQQTDIFSYGNNPEENNLFYTLSDFKHSDLFVPYYYYNTLQVLFSETE